MPALAKIGAVALLAGLAGALLAAIHLMLRRRLLRLRARRRALILVDVAAVLASSSFLVWGASGMPLAGWTALAALAAWLAAAVIPSLLIRITGGSRPTEWDVLLAAMEHAEVRLRRGEVEAWLVAVREMARWRTATTARLVDALQRLGDAGATAFADDRTAASLHEVERARDELLGIRQQPHRQRIVIVLLAVLLTGLPGAAFVARTDPCTAAELQLSVSGDAQSPPPSSLPDLLPTAAAVGAAPATQSYLTLDDAASVKYDPQTRAQLEDAGFELGYQVGWLLADGHQASADVFQFATPAGASAYQLAVTRYACAFATEHFDAGMGAVGLRIRYGSGDPYADQVSWVSGAYRVVVARTFGDPPPAGHGEVLRLAEVARAPGHVMPSP